MTHDERLELTQGIINLLDHWGADAASQVEILGLPQGTRAGVIRQYRTNKAFPDDPTVMERVEHLLGIADALRTAHPRNSQMDAMWMNRPNPRFDQRTPLAIMAQDGLNGVVAVRAQVDCSYDWYTDAARRDPAQSG
jgi:hypothetical protein